MNVSSVNNKWASLMVNSFASKGAGSAKKNGESSQDLASALTGVVATNSDGDTLQLSKAAQSAMLSATEMYEKMDTDADGSVTQEEFVATRPENVTEEMAANLYNSFDADESGSLTVTEYETAMNQGPPPPPPPSGAGGMGSSTESETFSDLDTNQDGVVSAEELAAARPENVSEEMAASLFKNLDADGSGGLTETEYAAKMGGNAGNVSSI
ncbi:MAG: EF-hand domain-containing protein [Negativicutes bacterium]